MINCQAGEKSR